MFCPECGNENPDTAKFCIKCGYNYIQPVSFEVTPQPLPSQNTVSEVSPRQNITHTKSSKVNTAASVFSTIAFTILGLIIVGILAFVGFQFYQHQTRMNSTNINSQQSYQKSSDSSSQVSESQNHQIVNQSFTLKATEYSYYKFTIPKSFSGGTVTGNFTASGGENDIYVIITNESGITNIKSGNNYKAFYNSGKVTTDDINVNLPPGTYYLVFSNIHSIMTPKAVNADVNVTY